MQKKKIHAVKDKQTFTVREPSKFELTDELARRFRTYRQRLEIKLAGRSAVQIGGEVNTP